MKDYKADWLEPRAAAERVVGSVDCLPSERSPLLAARGRVLAEAITSRIDLPRWTNSAMDGFAVRSADIIGASRENPAVLEVLEDVPAGSFPTRPVTTGKATRVMTGAPVPDGADTVIRVEHTDGGANPGTFEASVAIFDAHDSGKNLRRRGEDIRAGATALPAGSLLTPAAIGVAASLGYGNVAVFRRPLVALLTSGDELVELEEFQQVLEGRKIVSSNSYTLAAQLAEGGCEVRYLGIARDTPQSLAETLEGARGCDALITSAGVSVGEHDYVKEVLLSFGADAAFWRVRMRPGSPFAFGRIAAFGGIPWFGLPGNPVSSMVTFELFARPALLRMAGRSRVYRRPIAATLLEDHNTLTGLTQFVRVRLDQDEEGRVVARVTGPQGSGILTSVALAEGLMIVPPDAGRLQAGQPVSVIPLESSPAGFAEAPPF